MTTNTNMTAASFVPNVSSNVSAFGSSVFDVPSLFAYNHPLAISYSLSSSSSSPNCSVCVHFL